MSNAARKHQRRHVPRVRLDPSAGVTASMLAMGTPGWAVKRGARVAVVPGAAADENAGALAKVRTATHDDVIALVEQIGGTRIGPVTWRTSTSNGWADALAEAVPADRRAEFDAYKAAHPGAVLVVATVVAVPPQVVR